MKISPVGVTPLNQSQTTKNIEEKTPQPPIREAYSINDLPYYATKPPFLGSDIDAKLPPKYDIYKDIERQLGKKIVHIDEAIPGEVNGLTKQDIETEDGTMYELATTSHKGRNIGCSFYEKSTEPYDPYRLIFNILFKPDGKTPHSKTKHNGTETMFTHLYNENGERYHGFHSEDVLQMRPVPKQED